MLGRHLGKQSPPGHVDHRAVEQRLRRLRFRDTNGTAPQAGVDIEPLAARLVRNLRFVGCIFEGNSGRGFVVDDLGAGSELVENIIVEGCHAYSNTLDGFYVNQVMRGVVIANCIGTSTATWASASPRAATSASSATM